MKPDLQPERVLVATDFSPASRAATLYASAIARRSHARLYVLHVLPGDPEASNRAAAQAGAGERRAIEAMRRLGQDELLGCDYICAVLAGEPAARIVEKAKAVEADLIVLGVQEPCDAHTKDIPTRVVEASRCPVTCVPYRADGAS